jgi:hypothetical protein
MTSFFSSNFGFNAQLLLHKGVGKKQQVWIHQSRVAKIYQPSERGLVAEPIKTK